MRSELVFGAMTYIAAVLFWTRSSVLSSSCRFWKGSPIRNALRCSRRDVMMARVLALQRQSSTDVRDLSNSCIDFANA
jgi:hypothetical protein